MIGKILQLLDSKKFVISLLCLLLIPTFYRMLKPGIFTMHDFHVFRLYEYGKCVSDLQIPCRWAPDAAFYYGQPMFNFYAQLPYVFGQLFRFLGLSVLDSIKALFIASIVLSALGMFLLAKQVFKSNLSGLVSSIVYTYAPYRAVDVWVRGALPEALSFVYFPYLTYFFNDFVENKKYRSLLIFNLLFAALILTHNLSALMFSLFLLIWGIYLMSKLNGWRLIPHIIIGGILAIGISAFYIIPVVFESKLISLTKTTQGYYSFENHFVSLRQLLISRYWGYGGSLWGDDDRLSLSVGHIQWLAPSVIIFLALFLRKVNDLGLNFAVPFGSGWLMLFLTHIKSRILWVLLPPIAFIQFPWRFLGSTVFSFALASGVVTQLLKGKLLYIFTSAVVISAILLNVEFFREDIWLNFSDKEFFSGTHFDDQAASAVDDYWPKYGSKSPRHPAQPDPLVIEGSASGKLVQERSNKVEYQVGIASDQATLQFPVVYFPGWEGYSKEKLDIYPSGEFGLITVRLKKDDKNITLHFRDTLPRTVGNIISLLSILLWIYLFFSRFKIGQALSK